MTHPLHLDHIVVSAETLDEGVAWLSDRLGARPFGGGRHPRTGTHNALIRMGEVYAEVIARDPDADPAAHDLPVMFGVDRFTGPPRLTNWVARTTDLPAALALAPEGAGTAEPLSRGALRWLMGIPDGGVLPLGGTFPGLIDWGDTPHPVGAMPDSGLRLTRLILGHPEPEAVRAALAPFAPQPLITITAASAPSLSAEIATPSGLVTLQ